MKQTLKVGVLASGSGTDLQSIIDASENNMIPAQVVVVISDKKDAKCLQRAKNHTIAQYFLDPCGKDKESYDQQITTILQNHGVELVVGAGYMRLLSKKFVQQWDKKLINIHPALLPSFKGTNAQKDAFEYGVKISGCTTHFIDNQMDHGPIILQAAVKVLSNDTPESLASKILEVEHQLLPRTIQLYAEKRLQIKGRTVTITKGDSWLNKYNAIPDVLYSDGY